MNSIDRLNDYILTLKEKERYCGRMICDAFCDVSIIKKDKVIYGPEKIIIALVKLGIVVKVSSLTVDRLDMHLVVSFLCRGNDIILNPMSLALPSKEAQEAMYGVVHDKY